MSGEPRLWIALAVVALAVALAQTARLAWSRASRGWALRARSRHAARGEVLAEGLLRSAGYAILARQAAGSWTVHADGTAMAIDLRADYLVARGGRRFVAEVKTGRHAPRLETAATRRQLLEYRYAFDVDGVLLVDADAERVSAVEFATSHAEARRGSGAGWVLVLALGAILGALAAVALR